MAKMGWVSKRLYELEIQMETKQPRWMLFVMSDFVITPVQANSTAIKSMS